MKGNDYVYTSPITRAQSTLQEAVNNRAAALPATLPWQPLRWTPITMLVNQKTHTMSTLFGNDTAVKSLRKGTVSPDAPGYDQGAVLALVTWAERDAPHWFGGRIPDNPVSVEFVTVGSNNKRSYRGFEGPNLLEAHPPSDSIAPRTSFMVGLRPAPLP